MKNEQDFRAEKDVWNSSRVACSSEASEVQYLIDASPFPKGILFTNVVLAWQGDLNSVSTTTSSTCMTRRELLRALASTTNRMTTSSTVAPRKQPRPSSTMERKRNDPVAPLPIPSSYLVLRKLKQWDECQTRVHDNPRSKDQIVHLEQVRQQLFSMLDNVRHSIPKFRHNPTYEPELHNESAPRVDRFLAAHRCYVREWKKMGFRPSEESSRPSERGEFSVMQVRWSAARATVAILAELGLPCAIFGSMACKLYGNLRVPKVRSFLYIYPVLKSSHSIGHRRPRSSASRACFNYTGRD